MSMIITMTVGVLEDCVGSHLGKMCMMRGWRGQMLALTWPPQPLRGSWARTFARINQVQNIQNSVNLQQLWSEETRKTRTFPKFKSQVFV